ncbi:hypothetical protein V7183_03585 [Bacillus sp. JJ1127]|uniref:hypothetical protein n=1 Tax=Bacillus sp. JJ1127 TaxID=3122952 RepID=UPI0030004E32
MSELQQRFNEALEKIAHDYSGFRNGLVEQAVIEIARLRLELIELITGYATDDIINRSRMGALLRDLDIYEQTVRKHAELTFEKIIVETAKWTTSQLATIGLFASIATPLDRTLNFVNKHVLKFLINREGTDGLILSDRVWNLAGGLRDELSKKIRSSIIRGESISKLSKAIKEVHDNEAWKIRRVAVSESNNAYRGATLYSAQESNIVKAVKLIDNGHRHPNHSNHVCHKLAKADDYGLGAGVYPMKESLMAQLISPHPQCSSRLNYIMKDEV